jgi:hypothetical protein
MRHPKWVLLVAAFVAAQSISSSAQTSPPASGIYGNTGLWRVLTTETLPARQASFAASYDWNHRNPGDLRIRTLGFGAAFGMTDRLEGAVHFEAHRHVRVGRPEQLSLGQQALGFFGAQSPGSPPLPSELMPDSSRVPQLRSPPHPIGGVDRQSGILQPAAFRGTG